MLSQNPSTTIVPEDMNTINGFGAKSPIELDTSVTASTEFDQHNVSLHDARTATEMHDKHLPGIIYPLEKQPLCPYCYMEAESPCKYCGR